MLMQKNNIAEVQKAFSRGVIVDYAGASDLNAEIVPGQQAHWHVIEPFPSHERIVAAHLVGRRFGMYLPEMQFEPIITKRGELRRGVKFTRPRLMLGAYVLVFVWNIGAHWDRITNIPGVRQIMCNAEGHEIVLSDGMVDRIRAAENVLSPGDLVNVMKIAKRRWRKSRLPDDDGGEPVRTRCWDPFKDIVSVDGSGENQTLAKALGLAS